MKDFIDFLAGEKLNEEELREMERNMQNAMVQLHRRARGKKAHITKYQQARKLYNDVTDRMEDYYAAHREECHKRFLNDGFRELGEHYHENINFDFDDAVQAGLFYDFMEYPHFKGCLCDKFLREHKFRSKQNVSMVQAMLASERGLFQITDINKDNCIVILEHMLTGNKVSIVDETLAISAQLPIKELLYLRILTWEGVTFQSGVAIQFPKNYSEIRKWIKENKTQNNTTKQMFELYLLDRKLRKRR